MPPTVFISYSHKDKRWKDRLVEQLGVLEGRLDLWDDSRIRPGVDWLPEIEVAMAGAQVAVLMISAASLNSPFIKQEEIPALMKRRQEEGLLVIPVIVGACQWKKRDWLKSIQALPLNGEPLAAMRKSKADAELSELADVISAAAGAKRASPGTKPPDPAPLPTAGRHEPRSWTDIQVAVQAGLFTPVLGPGCYQLPELQRLGKGLVRARIRLISERTSAVAKEFLEGVAASKIPDLLDSKEGPAQPQVLDELVDFQVSLGELGAACCMFMGDTMGKSPRGFTKVRSFYAPVSTTSGLGGDLRERFFIATDRAAELMSGASDTLRDQGLGARGILERMVALTLVVFKRYFDGPSPDGRTQEWRNRYRQYLEAAGSLVKQEEPDLSLARLEWIGNLLWHTLRFDKPMYPTLEELAFQLSLHAAEPMLPRRERASTMAELADRRSREELIPRWYQRYSAGAGSGHSGAAEAARTQSDVGSHLYQSLARALWACRPRSTEGHEPHTQSTYAAASDDHLEPVGVAITTNLDKELEAALDRLNAPYVVIFPVWLLSNADPRGHNNAKADWIIRTEVPGDEASFRILGERELNQQDLGVPPRGPLIVKLHGSPLHELPMPAALADGPEYSHCRLQHRFVLSDADFVDAIVRRERSQHSRLPNGLEELVLQEGRCLCFVGLPLGDLYGRFALYDHLGSAAKVALLLVDRPKDPVRHRLLAEIDVDFVEANFQELANRLDEWLPSRARVE